MKLYLYILFIFLLLDINVSAQWTIKNLNENSSKVGNIKFQNDTLGYLIGGDSYFLKTTDSGGNWEKQELKIQVNISDYQLIGDSSIIAVGDSKLVKSTNFGKSWDSISSLVEKQLLSLWFFNDDSGLVAGYDGIYRTVNKGNLWDTVWSITQFGYKYGDVTKLVFPSTDIGYAIGIGRNQTNNPNFDNFLLKSNDSGKTWVKVKSFSDNLTTISFINGAIGFVGTELGTIYKTIDGGDNWTESLQTTRPVKSIQFISETKVYATGGVTGYVVNGGGYYKFFISQTVDGGQNWATYDTTGVPLNSICFIDENIGFVAGEFELIMKSNGIINILPEDYPWHLVENTGISLGKRLNSDFNIYPNPTNGILYIQIINSNRKIEKIHLINTSGQLVDIGKFNADNQVIQLNLSDLLPGLYILKIKSSAKDEIMKIIRK